MRKVEIVLRLIAYACGVGGMLLAIQARGAPPGAAWMGTLGWALLGVMFVLFLVTYALRVVAMLRRTGRRRRPKPPDVPDRPA